MYSYGNGKMYDENMNIVAILKETEYGVIRLFHFETEYGNSIAMESIDNATNECRLLLTNPERYLNMINELNK